MQNPGRQAGVFLLMQSQPATASGRRADYSAVLIINEMMCTMKQ
jgi:hypothetical protein